MRRVDYAGAESCCKCHQKNYDNWSAHPHRWMNAAAKPENVKGDFDARSIDYLGGRATFYRDERGYRMRLERDGLVRVFHIDRTIGWRFFQYYVGTLVEGPEPQDHVSRNIQGVLPFGYWLDAAEWVPVVHVHGEPPDGHRDDPFGTPGWANYNKACATCHTTLTAGNWMLRKMGMDRMRWYLPRSVAFNLSDYLAENHPDLLDPAVPLSSVPRKQVLVDAAERAGDPAYAVNLGISCEACHNGCQEHVDNPENKPMFFVAGRDVLVKERDPHAAWGRTPENKNWTCARCHSGNRPRYAAGISTWNSTEYTDAERGHNCYDADRAYASNMELLTCVHCHEPHTTIGKRWTPTPLQDDAKCLHCHQQFQPEPERIEHTHHPVDSAGSRCMNCHMPRINEGLQDMVRTHQIFSPTEPRMLEANQANACNMCHLDKPIDWTLDYLAKWYTGNRNFVNDAAIQFAYPDRNGPVGAGWLKSPHKQTRLVAADALCRNRSRWALGPLIDALDDPFLLNRQFTQKGLEEMLDTDLRKAGYRFYMTPQERRPAIQRIKQEHLSGQASTARELLVP
jgi:ferredoxin